MKAQINNLDLSYKGNEVDNVRIRYRIGEGNIRGNGRFSVSSSEYDGSIKNLESICGDHIVKKIDDASVSIESTKVKYDGDEIGDATIHFRASTENASLNLSGNYEMNAEDYQENITPDALKDFTKDYLKNLVETDNAE
ncbi:hypothetical protein [Oceanobacillus oncorhynchi]|uniref:hypothetical protein n=1 Tax=Oceanobacillus oncorhynchi TaxID=545501 RepID=UPI001865F64E|nr:hypothetical protein [Oceanobacillus oncorhynchi]